MHPKSSEVVMCTTDVITLTQEAAGDAVVEVTLGLDEYAFNEPGVWQTADVINSAKQGSSTQGRARSDSHASSSSFETVLTYLLRMKFFYFVVLQTSAHRSVDLELGGRRGACLGPS